MYSMDKPRSPIVVVLGHVDHGKTTLLDYIRKTQVAAKEHGGITQKIGAYSIDTKIKGYATSTITFIDTPGHEAFSQLRARGANVADVALLMVDAKDSLMPQTIESIFHIKAAKIPFIVVINKIDLPDANIEKVKNDLIKHDVLVEEKGGKVLCIPVSAKTGKGVDELLESILLLCSDLNLTYNLTHALSAFIIETKKNKRGISASVIIKDGVLKLGDMVFAENNKAKIRALVDDKGVNRNEVAPSMPFELFGFEELPQIGVSLSTTSSISTKTETVIVVKKSVADLESFLHESPKEKKISLILKADSQGSLEAIHASLSKNNHFDMLLIAVGDIYKSDVFLAKTSKSILVGFNTKIAPEVADLAKQEKVIIKTYTIIYELLDELNEVADLLKEKEQTEKNLKGEAKILANFVIEREKIFGVKITKGKIAIGDELEIHRNNNLIGKTKLVSLQVRAKKIEEVKKDQEAGMVFSPSLDIRIGDVVKCIL